MRVIRFLLLVVVMMLVVVSAKKNKKKKDKKRKKKEDPKDCEVCIKVVTDIVAKIPKDKKKDTDFIEKIIDDHCESKASKRKLSRQEKKLCYFILPIKRLVSKPISFGMYPDEVCKRKLKKKTSDICSVKFPIKTNKNTNYKKMRVRHLKQILADRGVACTGCLEKRDYIKKVKETEHLAL